MLRNAEGGGGINFSEEKRYEGVRFNVISVTRGWVGFQIPGKKRYVTLEWPHTRPYAYTFIPFVYGSLGEWIIPYTNKSTDSALHTASWCVLNL